jgi:hypothetical protein
MHFVKGLPKLDLHDNVEIAIIIIKKETKKMPLQICAQNFGNGCGYFSINENQSFINK